MTKNRQLYIDQEALATLGLLEYGLLYPVVKPMTSLESQSVDENKKFNGITYPFSLIFAPSGKRNEKVLTTVEENETLDLVCDGEIHGKIIASEVFKINREKRISLIYGTQNREHPGVKDTYRRLGNYAISGDCEVDYDIPKQHKKDLENIIQKTHAQNISAIMLTGKPFHRVHERLVRTALVQSDLLVLFILKPCNDDFLPFKTRYKTIKYFCDHYLPKDKVVLIPLENTYIFGGFNELILNAIVAKNFGCDKLIIGKNHAGLGAFYNDVQFCTILDNIEGVDIDIDLMSEFVYCDRCSTLVSKNACPHGHHHHIKYHPESLLKLLELGIMPPAVLMRKEISSIILSDLLPDRLDKLNEISQYIFPSSGLIDDFDSKDFYESLMDLYQTSSLT